MCYISAQIEVAGDPEPQPEPQPEPEPEEVEKPEPEPEPEEVEKPEPEPEEVEKPEPEPEEVEKPEVVETPEKVEKTEEVEKPEAVGDPEPVPEPEVVEKPKEADTPPRSKLWSISPGEGVDLAMEKTGVASVKAMTIGELFRDACTDFPSRAGLRYKEGDEWKAVSFKDYYTNCINAAKSFIKVCNYLQYYLLNYVIIVGAGSSSPLLFVLYNI